MLRFLTMKVMLTKEIAEKKNNIGKERNCQNNWKKSRQYFSGTKCLLHLKINGLII